jgi:hypothetical protein
MQAIIVKTDALFMLGFLRQSSMGEAANEFLYSALDVNSWW